MILLSVGDFTKVREILKGKCIQMASYPYMRPPKSEYKYEVGDKVEVFCDHEKEKERIRGWLQGIVVQVDSKMVAVQFRTNVFLTDGWMVPDHILWYPVDSTNIRYPEKKSARKLFPRAE